MGITEFCGLNHWESDWDRQREGGFQPAAMGSWRTELLLAEHTQETQPAACSAAAQLAGTVWPGNSGAPKSA